MLGVVPALFPSLLLDLKFHTFHLGSAITGAPTQFTEESAITFGHAFERTKSRLRYSFTELLSRLPGLSSLRKQRNVAPYFVQQHCVLHGENEECDVFVELSYPNGIQKPLPLLFHIHGGGYVVGAVNREYVRENYLLPAIDAGVPNMIVADVHYRLAPKHKIPTQFEDCVKALTYLISEAESFRIDVSKIFVGGGSAGGQLSASLAIWARDNLSALNEKAAIAGQILLYPSTDMVTDVLGSAVTGRGPYMSMVSNSHWPSLSYSLKMAFLDASLPGSAGPKPLEHVQRDGNFSITYPQQPQHTPASRLRAETANDWRVSPIIAPSLQGLPPALVILCELDVLRDEGLAYAQRLIREGVEVTLHESIGAVHAFDYYRFFYTEQSDTMRSLIGSFIARQV